MVSSALQSLRYSRRHNLKESGPHVEHPPEAVSDTPEGLPPAAEKKVSNYQKTAERGLVGIALLGIAATLGEKAYSVWGTGNGFLWIACAAVIFAALGLVALAIPLFIFVVASWTSPAHFDGPGGIGTRVGCLTAAVIVVLALSLTVVLKANVDADDKRSIEDVSPVPSEQSRG